MEFLGMEIGRKADIDSRISAATKAAAKAAMSAAETVQKSMADSYKIEIETMKKTYEEKLQYVNKQLEVVGIMRASNYGSDRPNADMYRAINQSGVQMPLYPLPMLELYDMALYSDTLRTTIFAKATETFRNGIETYQRFVRKCPECDTEFEEENLKCDNCNVDTVSPDVNQLKMLNSLVKQFRTSVNENGQTLIDVLKSEDIDVNIIDDMYHIVTFEYIYSPKGEIANKIPKEHLRGHPIFMKKIADYAARPGRDATGQQVYTCPVHRDQLLKIDRCGEDQCGKMCYPAHFVAIGMPNRKPLYYFEWEVIHISEFSPSLTYGFPPVITVWQKAQALMDMDKYVKDYYQQQRPPKGMLMVPSTDFNGLLEAWEQYKEKLKENPHMIQPFAYEPGGNNSKASAQFISFMNNLEEMQYTQARQEMREAIGALYGVMPIFQANTKTSGGLNNEGLQITVTSHFAQNAQGKYNDKLFPKILELYGISDWGIRLKPPSERDVRRDVEIDILRAQHAQIMKGIGFQVILNDKGEFEFEMPEGGLGDEGKQETEDPDMKDDGTHDDNMAPEKPDKDDMAEERMTKSQEFEKLKDEFARELKKILKTVDIRKKMTEEQMRLVVNKVASTIKARLKSRSNKAIREIYMKAMDRVEMDLNKNVMFGVRDENAIHLLSEDEIFTKAYEGVTESVSKRLNEIIEKAYNEPEKFTISHMVEDMQKVADETEGRLTTIARTETHRISNVARMNSYMQLDTDNAELYKWLNPLDHRTTPTCKAIVERTKDGVTLAQMKAIIEEEAIKTGFTARELTPHPNCRSTFIRLVGKSQPKKKTIKRIGPNEYEVEE